MSTIPASVLVAARVRVRLPRIYLLHHPPDLPEESQCGRGARHSTAKQRYPSHHARATSAPQPYGSSLCARLAHDLGYGDSLGPRSTGIGRTLPAGVRRGRACAEGRRGGPSAVCALVARVSGAGAAGVAFDGQAAVRGSVMTSIVSEIVRRHMYVLMIHGKAFRRNHELKRTVVQYTSGAMPPFFRLLSRISGGCR